MQAGDILETVLPSYPVPDYEGTAEVTERPDVLAYKALWTDMMLTSPADMRQAAFANERDEIFEVSEVSLKLSALDGSYLHIMTYSQEPMEDVESDYGRPIFIDEHDEDGVRISGRMYFGQDGKIMRTDVPSTTSAAYHVSIFDIMDHRRHVQELAASEWDADKQRAEDARAIEQRNRTNSELAAAMGEGPQQVPLAELEKLASVLQAAVPFTA